MQAGLKQFARTFIRLAPDGTKGPTKHKMNLIKIFPFFLQ